MQLGSENKPVIIGAGLAGMAISDRLSRANISHILLGAGPNTLPRLGESLDPAGTLELLRSYPEYKQFYFKKRWISVFVGDYATACKFDQSLTRILALRMMGFRSPAQFVHVDRIGFDQAFWERVTADPCCLRIESQVVDVEYDTAADEINTLRLENGQQLSPAYVFDCTNHVRLLGRALELGVKRISKTQRIVFSHYHASAELDQARWFDVEWKHATNIVRMYRDMDGANGLAWAIPLGSYISVGVSMPQGDNELPAEEVLALTLDAYHRRGMPIGDTFTDRREVIDIPRQEYFFHERAYGANWLLAGPPYGQIWFPSSSGVGAALVAGAIAPVILDRPAQVGQAYQGYVLSLMESHHIFDRMIERHYSSMTRDLVKKESNRIVGENAKRVARLALIQNSRLYAPFARALIAVLSIDGVAVSGCKAYKVPLTDQTPVIFAQA